ncbi:MAG TPA: hypothetical protein VHC48_00140 [Puia sp.]|nr:hypothetical protein [Puia sp.]
MKTLLFLTLILLSIYSFGQKITQKALINGSSSLEGAFVFFPLTSDSIKLDNPNLFLLLKQNVSKKLFYCVYNDEKSKIYDLTTDTLTDSIVNFKIPDPLFYRNLYKAKLCPFCHKSEYVVPFVYGKPSAKAIKLAERGEIKLAGCSLSNTSPRLYCKADKLEF